MYFDVTDNWKLAWVWRENQDVCESHHSRFGASTPRIILGSSSAYTISRKVIYNFHGSTTLFTEFPPCTDLLRAQGIISQHTRSAIANAPRIPKDEPSAVKPSKHSNRMAPHSSNEDTRSKLQKLKPDPIHDEDVIIIESSDDDGGAGLQVRLSIVIPLSDSG